MIKLTCLFVVIFITTSSSLNNDEENKMAPMPMKNGNDRDMGGMKDNETLPDLMAIMNECNETFRIDMAYLEALNDSGTFPDETDKTPKCFIRCILEKTGVASSEGQFNASRAAFIFATERNGRPHDDLEDSAKACTERSESCKCERAYNFVRCMIEKDIENHEKPYIGEPEEDSK